MERKDGKYELVFDLSVDCSLATGGFVSIFSVILTFHTSNLTPRTEYWADPSLLISQIFFVKLFYISIEKIFNFERQMIQYFPPSCIKSAVHLIIVH